mgnify:CR=1 FL=1
MFTDDFHLRTLSPFLSAVAQLHPKVAIKSIVIALIDRLAAYAAREAENESPEERQRQEEEAARRLVGEVKKQRERARNGDDETEGWGAVVLRNGGGQADDDGLIDGQVPRLRDDIPVRKFRGIPEDVKLFEVFWHQIVELIKVRFLARRDGVWQLADAVAATQARPDLSIQDITALLVSLVNLSLSCYPDKLEYVDQVLGFARAKVTEYADSPDLHQPSTIAHLLALLLAPITSYLTVLTLLALPSYQALLLVQPFATRRSIAHAIVASILKNETVIESPEDVKGVLDLCHVLVRDQRDRALPNSAGLGPTRPGQQLGGGGRGQQQYDVEEMAEEQGWIARMVHLFRSDDLEVQFKLLQMGRKEFGDGGDRIRWTFPPLIVAAIKLARRYKFCEARVADWEPKISSLFKFIHQCTAVLYNKVESSDICLRLYLLALSAADEAGLEELAYEFAVQAFTIYEESISESRAQLQAITLIISTLQTTRVFGTDNYDTLITKAALHGAKLLKKGQQATAVALASHLWWQTEVVGREGATEDKVRLLVSLSGSCADVDRCSRCTRTASACSSASKSRSGSPRPPSTSSPPCSSTATLWTSTSTTLSVASTPFVRRLLERSSLAHPIELVQISAKHINSLVELIASNMDSIHTTDASPSAGATSGLIEGIGSPEAVQAHFKNTLLYSESFRARISCWEVG